jgi:hypothetical protein
MIRGKKIVANLFVLGCWIVIGVATWWAFLDRSEVVKVQYQHPLFTNQIANNKEETRKYEIREAKAGQTIWRYLERRLLKDYPGQIRLLWIADGFQYQLPVTPNAQKSGCHKKSIGVLVPPIPGHEAEPQVATLFQRNPLATELVRLEPMRLSIK